MKLIIDIPEETFNEVREKENIDITTLNISIRAIENGTPLDDVKAEIEEYRSTIDRAISEDELKIKGMKEAYTNCLKIIDNIGKESEEE